MSSSIPDQEVAGRVRFETGSFQNQQMHAVVGGTQGQWGYNLEFMQLSSNGFKNLDTGGDTGFDKTDVVAKLQWTSSSGQHKVRIKGAQSGESSRETYLGLAQQDFARQVRSVAMQLPPRMSCSPTMPMSFWDTSSSQRRVGP